MASLEILAVLAEEVAEANSVLDAALADSFNSATSSDAWERYAEQVEMVRMACEALQLEGLAYICTLVLDNVKAIRTNPADYTLERKAQFERWPGLLLSYLRAPKDRQNCHNLAQLFHEPGWPHQLDESLAEALETRLFEISLLAEADESKVRATEVTAEDVALDVPTDINPILVEALLSEGPLQVQHYSAILQQVINGEAGIEMLDEARRVVHAVKGAANTVGVRGLANLSHHLEDILEAMAQNAVRPEGELAKLLMRAADCLEMMFESLVEGKEAPPQSLEVLQQVLACATQMDSGEFDFVSAPTPQSNIPTTSAATVPIATAATAMLVPASLPADKTATKKTAAPTSQAVQLTRKLRIATSTVDGMLRLSGEMTIARAHIQERLHQAIKQLHDLRETHALLRRRGGELESVVTIQGVSAGERKHDAGMSSGSSAAGMSSTFDALEMDQYSTLHGEVHGLVETLADVQTLGNKLLDTLSALGTAVTQEGLVNNELHETIMGARMVAASAIEPRLVRTVRQACEATGKRATLTIMGGEVPLDDQMINALVDPLSHLLRNAVDHGIELPEVRAALGKPEEGNVRIKFARVGSYIEIECIDDGGGLNFGLIYDLALSRGLIDKQRELNDRDIARLILLPGFSTKAEVSQVSGRGVGMDIVHDALSQLKGEIDIRSETGQGCNFILRVPMSLGSAHCLLASAGDDVVAIPSENMERVVHAGASMIERAGREWMFRDELNICKAYDLSDLLGYAEEDSLGGANDQRPVIVLRDGQDKVAIVLDKLLGGRDYVIKGLGSYLGGSVSTIGASLTGDGRVLPVLNIIALLRRRQGLASNVVPLASRVAKSSMRVAAADAPDILVVDDSLSVRTSLTQFLNGEGYATRTAKDGIEALEEIAKRKPMTVLVDLEMPRMNGLEMTSRLRAQPDTQAIPIIMITSRAAEKHRAQAQLAGVDVYVTKPYREADLLAHLRSVLSKAA